MHDFAAELRNFFALLTKLTFKGYAVTTGQKRTHDANSDTDEDDNGRPSQKLILLNEDPQGTAAAYERTE